MNKHVYLFNVGVISSLRKKRRGKQNLECWNRGLIVLNRVGREGLADKGKEVGNGPHRYVAGVVPGKRKSKSTSTKAGGCLAFLGTAGKCVGLEQSEPGWEEGRRDNGANHDRTYLPFKKCWLLL